MNKPLLLIADADAIVAQAYVEDANHQITVQLGEKLREKGAHVLFPATAISEAITTLQRKLSNPKLAATTLELFTDSSMIIEMVDQEVTREAKLLFNPSGSKPPPPRSRAAIAARLSSPFLFSPIGAGNSY